MAVERELILGIDLGTTYSSACVVVDGRFHYALDARGEACVPSVVHFPRTGAPIVGAEADKLRATDPQNTVTGVKRIVGRSFATPQARLIDASSAYKLRDRGEDEVAIITRHGDIVASEVAAIIMRHLKERAEIRFGKKLAKAILTVPVTAPESVRETMVRVGRMAGLEVIRVLAEPVAGALARGLAGAADTGAPRLVFDFGGGTLDTTIVRRDGKAVRVLAASGDDCLGGDDFDQAFSRFITNSLWGARGMDVTKDAILSERILRQCEAVKRVLSSTREARFLVQDALGGSGIRRSIDLMVRREQLRTPWTELVQRSLECAKATVALAGVQTAELSAVTLIGGTTSVPQVREAMNDLGRPLDVENDPQTAVVRGAALLAVMPELLAA